MQTLLYLVHRIPYPPNKGDKIRSFHLLKHLAKKYNVILGAFVDDPDDWIYHKKLTEYCDEVFLLPLNPLVSRIKSFEGFFTQKALTIPYYWSGSMQKWVDKVVVERRIMHTLVFSAAMAQYVQAHRFQRLRRVIDFVDVDSDKWQQYKSNKSWPLSAVYSREGRRLLEYERAVAQKFDVSLFVSSVEAKLFKRLAPNVTDKVDYFNNGVDFDYFSPDLEYSNPYRVDQPVLVFTGAMDYWANVDAVCWFVKEVFPIIRSQVPDAVFYIVGSRPTVRVKGLGEIAGVVVTGKVKDIRPYLKYARVAVAPLRIARGVQNKILEAMAMDKLILATSAAIEGIEPWVGLNNFVVDGNSEMARRAITILKSRVNETNKINARDWIMEHYSWEKNLKRVEELIEGPGSRMAKAAISN